MNNEGLHDGYFCWNELMTADVRAAAAFYKNVFGWETAAFPGEGVSYTLFKKQGKDIGGMMALPMPEAPTQWLAYVVVEDVDGTVEKVERLGGKGCAPPRDIPTVGRIAVIQDPQGASLGIIKPSPREK